MFVNIFDETFFCANVLFVKQKDSSIYSQKSNTKSLKNKPKLAILYLDKESLLLFVYNHKNINNKYIKICQKKIIRMLKFLKLEIESF